MAEKNYIDCIILMHGELPGQLAWAPDRPSEVTAAGWAEAYGSYERLKQATDAIEEEAQRVFEAAEAGDISDDYDSVEDVTRDVPQLARVFEDGVVHLFGEALEDGELPVIAADARPDRIMELENIYGDFGLEVPTTAEAPGLGG